MDTGMLFGIIFAIIVMGFVIFFGYRYINDMACVQGESTTAQGVMNLDKAVADAFSLSMGSSKEFTFMTGACSGRICFIDSTNTESNPEAGWVTNNVFDEMISLNKYNVFILDGDGNFKNGKYIKNMRPDQNFCISTSKKLFLENKGRYVSVTESQPTQ